MTPLLSVKSEHIKAKASEIYERHKYVTVYKKVSAQRIAQIFKSISNGSSKTRMDQMQYDLAEERAMDVCSTSDNEEVVTKNKMSGDRETLDIINWV